MFNGHLHVSLLLDRVLTQLSQNELFSVANVRSVCIKWSPFYWCFDVGRSDLTCQQINHQ